MRWEVIQGRVEDVLASERLGKFDAVFCDPPYGIKFLGKEWDHGVPSADVWRLIRNHIYPGSNVVAFGGTKTWHRLATAMEESGLEMRDTILAWIHSEGFPKPGDISKFIDKALGVKRNVVSIRYDGSHNKSSRNVTTFANTNSSVYATTAPGSQQAEIWEGWHANLKPAWEPALMFREPQKGYAKNALAYGVAGLNIDATRIGDGDGLARSNNADSGMFGIGRGLNAAAVRELAGAVPLGRWPSNLLLCCDQTTCETEHQLGCPLYDLESQSPMASKFFYVPKVSRRERGESTHPCMKPLRLCEYIARLLLQPPTRKRRLLVPYSGSGSEMIGALQAGWGEVVGIEFDPTYVELSRRRIMEYVV